jgi:hypothetical protein
MSWAGFEKNLLSCMDFKIWRGGYGKSDIWRGGAYWGHLFNGQVFVVGIGFDSQVWNHSMFCGFELSLDYQKLV